MTVYIACPPVFPDGVSLLLADTSAQLMDFALMLGLDPPEVHDAHTAWEHIDLTWGGVPARCVWERRRSTETLSLLSC